MAKKKNLFYLFTLRQFAMWCGIGFEYMIFCGDHKQSNVIPVQLNIKIDLAVYLVQLMCLFNLTVFIRLE